MQDINQSVNSQTTLNSWPIRVIYRVSFVNIWEKNAFVIKGFPFSWLKIFSGILCHRHYSAMKKHSSVTCKHSHLLNPLRAKFFRGNINIYLHLMSFLHTNKTQVVEIPPRVRQWPAYSTQSISWLLMSWRRKEPGHQLPWYWPS